MRSNTRGELQVDLKIADLLRNYFAMLQDQGKSILAMLTRLGKNDFLYIFSQQISLCNTMMVHLYGIDDDTFDHIASSLCNPPSLASIKKFEEIHDKENQYARNGQDQKYPSQHLVPKLLDNSEPIHVTDDIHERQYLCPRESTLPVRSNHLNLEDLSSHFYNWSRKNSHSKSLAQELLANEESLGNQETGLQYQNPSPQR